MSVAGYGLAHPWALALLPLAAAPLVTTGLARIAHPAIDLVGPDPVSRLAEAGLRAAGALTIALIVLGLAAPYRDRGAATEPTGGASVVIVLDRSRSMNDTFAGRAAAGGELSKARAASELLLDFVAARPGNRYGLVAFSTSPIYALPLTDSQPAIRAALTAAAGNGLALTAMAGALGMASEHFDRTDDQGARVVLLVSDGAAAIPPDAAGPIRRWFSARDLRLYWLYIRTEGHPSLAPVADAGEQVPAEQRLHGYFQSLGVPYRAYEADNPEAMRRAIADIGELGGPPGRRTGAEPRVQLASPCYASALALVLLLLAARAVTVGRWA